MEPTTPSTSTTKATKVTSSRRDSLLNPVTINTDNDNSGDSRELGSPNLNPGCQQHRSRKEKLVLRSFSTDTEEGGIDMEPRILTREEFIKQSKRKKHRSNGSASSSATNTRESSPVDVKIESGTEVQAETNVENVAATNVEGEASSSKLVKPHKKTYKKRDPAEKAEKYKRKMEYKKSISKLKISPSFTNKIRVVHKPSTMQSSSHAKKRVHFSLNSSPRKGGLGYRIIGGTSTPSTSTATGAPQKPSGTKFTPIRTLYSHSSAQRKKVITPLPKKENNVPKEPTRKLVKYQLPSKYLLNKTETSTPCTLTTAIATTSEAAVFRTPDVDPSPSTSSSSSSSSSLLVTRKKLGSMNNKSVVKPDLFKPKEDLGDDSLNSQNEALVYSYGLNRLSSLLQEVGCDSPITLPQFCMEAVAKLAKSVVEKEEPTIESLIPNGHTTVKQKKIEKSISLLRKEGKRLISSLNEERDDDNHSIDPDENKPKFPVGSTLLPKPPMTFPRIAEEELDVLKELLNPEEEFQCYEDELEMVKVYMELMKSELQLVAKEEEGFNVLQKPKSAKGKDEKIKKIEAFAIPLTAISEEEKSMLLPGLVIKQEELLKKLVKKKEKISEESITTKNTRSGEEEVDLENAKIEEEDWGSVSDSEFEKLPASTAPAIIMDTSTVDQTLLNSPFMALRTGKSIPYSSMENEGHFKIEFNPDAEGKLNLFGSKSEKSQNHTKDEYEERVRAHLNRLREGKSVYDYDYDVANQNQWMSSSSASASSGSLSSLSNKSQSTNSILLLNGPQPNLNGSPEPSSASTSGSISNTNSATNSPMKTPSCQSPLPKSKPYTRRHHSTICPPFENNHCSYQPHLCTYPRAPGSRFCINHVDQGATLSFERCKYVKGARECGRYIPKSSPGGGSLQLIFCEFHASLVAKARRKMIKPRKTEAGKVPLLLKHAQYNLDRVKGAIMEVNEEGTYQVRRELLRDESETLNNSSGSDTEDEKRVVGKKSVSDLLKAQAAADSDSDVEDCEWFSEQEDNDSGEEVSYSCLRNAGYYTFEEAVKIYREKLQQKRNVVLRLMELEKKKYTHSWKKYCTGVKRLKKKKVNFTTDPSYLSTANPTAVSQSYIKKQMRNYQEMNAMLAHRQDHGPRAVLRRQVLRKRAEMFAKEPPNSELIKKYQTKEDVKLARRLKPIPTCAYGKAEGLGHGDICTRRVFPLSRFCFNHILHDKTQTLYKKCGFKYGSDDDDECKTPVLKELQKFGCTLHALPVPPKDPPPRVNENRKPKVEEEIDKLMEKAEDEGDAEYEEEELEKEMQELVGDEVIGFEHLRETVRSIYAKGIYTTDSEESDDTEEDEDETPQEEVKIGAPSTATSATSATSTATTSSEIKT